MFQNPIIQTILLFFGAYTVMAFLHRKEPLDLIVTAFAGIVVVVLWMLRYNRAAAHSVYGNPVMKPFIDLVCSIAKEQPPVDAVEDGVAEPVAVASGRRPDASLASASTAGARPRQAVSARSYSQGTGAASAAAPARASSAGASTQEEKTPLLLLSESDFRLAAFQIQQQMFGINKAIEQIMSQLQRNLKVREKGAPTAHLPPVGMFLLIGRSGLGKRTLATEIGKRLYSGRSVALLDLSETGATLEPMVAAAKSNPYQTFIIENLESAPRRTQDDLLAIVAGQALVDGQSGSRVSFRHCCLFFLIHKDAGNVGEGAVSGAREGFTVVAERVASETSLDNLLAQGLHGVIPFQLPDKQEQAEAVAQLMESECRKYQLTLGNISPAVLAREVQEISGAGSFKGAPPRVSRIMSRAIHDAVEAKRTSVDVS